MYRGSNWRGCKVWPNARAWRAREPQGSVDSNPTLSAGYYKDQSAPPELNQEIHFTHSKKIYIQSNPPASNEVIPTIISNG